MQISRYVVGPKKLWCNFQNVIFNLVLLLYLHIYLYNAAEIDTAVRADYNSTLVQVMAWWVLSGTKP